MKPSVTAIGDELFLSYPALCQCRDTIIKTYDLCEVCFRNDGKLLVCGNGGSAADAEHIVGELMKGFRLKREIPAHDREKILTLWGQKNDLLYLGLQQALPAISLVSHTALITAYANDVHADMIFAQQVYGYGRKNDVLLVLSTSGNARNICYAAQIGKAKGLAVVGMTGIGGGELAGLCDVTIRVPSDVTFSIQEYHQPIYHALCAMLEEEFFGEKK